MRVFLDTNVLVGAFVTRGLCADVLELVLTEHELVVGEAVLAELKRVLIEKLAAEFSLVKRTERLLRQQSVVPHPATHLSLGLCDPDDEWIVASAVAGQADVLVTGDADRLEAQDRMPILVVSPRESWRLLRGGDAGSG